MRAPSRAAAHWAARPQTGGHDRHQAGPRLARRCRAATAAAPRTSAAPAPRQPPAPPATPRAPAASESQRGRRVARVAASAVAVAALAATGVTERAPVAASFAVLGHLHWLWIPAAIGLESASMAAFAIMLRRLLAVGAASIGIRPMLATAYAANALSVSVPLAGPELATAFTFRRFTRQGADAPLAGWSLLVGGVVSAAAGVLVVGGGGLASGNILATAAGVPGGVLALAVLIGVAAATRRPRLRGALERPAAWALRHGSRLARRPAGDPRQTVRAWATRLGSLQLPPSGWMMVTGLALVATGLHANQALAAVLLYRLASFWLVALAGWLVLLWLHHRKRARRGTGIIAHATARGTGQRHGR